LFHFNIIFFNPLLESVLSQLKSSQQQEKMQEQIVSFPPEANEKVGQYCIDHSVSLPGYFKEHKEYTEQNYPNPGIYIIIHQCTA
jgi:hypothetical protein